MATPPTQTTPATGITVEELPRHLRMRRVTEQELDALGSVKTGLGLTFAGASLGAFIAFWIVLRTVPGLPADDLATFRALTFVTGAMTLFFAAWSFIEGRGTRQLIHRIRGRGNLGP